MRSTLAAATAAALLLAACRGSATAERDSLAVYAASSLADAFGALEALFEEHHPEVDVALTFAGSQVLRIQIEEGAPADVFASADPWHMAALIDEGLVSRSTVFAHNELVVIVPLDNPAAVESFGDLPAASRLVLGTPETPVGRYARQALHAADSAFGPGFEAKVMERLVSEEPNARLARSKVELGEADAAIVYATDATDRVRSIPIPGEASVRADYLIGVVGSQRPRALAEAWMELVRSAEGLEVLRRHGFQAP